MIGGWLLVLAALPGARAGYGDVDADGFPSWEDRELHLWTNAFRMDPEHFKDEVGCWNEFEPSEQTPKAPLGYDRTLNEAGRFHSEDMADNDHFAHESSDGTSFGDRLARFYDSGFIGENIAWGYPTAFDAMLGWMCSAGHRSNIMLADWTELGTGVIGVYYTQDFGGGAADTSGAVKMGVHSPKAATDAAEFRVDFADADPPARIEVVVDGTSTPLELVLGAPDQGLYGADVTPAPADCHRYFFTWETAKGTTGTFPEGGSYLYGEACDNPLMFEPLQDAPGGGNDGGLPSDWDVDEDGDGAVDPGAVKLVGCAVAPGAGLAGALGALAGLVLRRRRR